MKSKPASASAARGRDSGRRPQADLARSEWQKFAVGNPPRTARSPSPLSVLRRR